MKQLPGKQKQRWIYLDWPLAAFVTVMVAAATITSHGTFVFYDYILSDAGAYAATIVLTIGIPLLQLAGILDKKYWWRYIGGMVFLLFLEGLAQYYQGQAVFVPSIVKQFPNPLGIDLATFAAQPEGRLLPALYLAALSGVVVYFGHAVGIRVRDLREAAGLTVNVDAATTKIISVNRPMPASMTRRALPASTGATLQLPPSTDIEQVDKWIAWHNNGKGMSYGAISRHLGGDPSRQHIGKCCKARRAQLAALTVEANV